MFCVIAYKLELADFSENVQQNSYGTNMYVGSRYEYCILNTLWNDN